MTLFDEIAKVAARVVRAHTPTDPKNRLNSFFVMSDFSELNAANFEKSFQDGVISHYWGRAWEASGQDVSKVCAEFNALFIKRTGSGFNACKDWVREKVQVGVVVPYLCEDCGRQSQAEADALAILILKSVVRELAGVAKFGNDYLTAAEAGAATLSGCNGWNNFFCTDADVRVFGYGADKLTVAVADFEGHGCPEPLGGFAYSGEIAPTFAEVKCSTC